MIEFPTPWTNEGPLIYSNDGEYIAEAADLDTAKVIVAKVNTACGDEWTRWCEQRRRAESNTRGMENRITEKREA